MGKQVSRLGRSYMLRLVAGLPLFFKTKNVGEFRSFVGELFLTFENCQKSPKKNVVVCRRFHKN